MALTTNHWMEIAEWFSTENSRVSTLDYVIMNQTTELVTINQIKLSDFLKVKIGMFLNLYLEAALLFSGMICNLLVLAVMWRHKYRTSDISSYTYMRSLAVFDFVVLSVNLMTHWINYNFRTSGKNVYLCKTILFLARFILDCSAWIIVCMTIDRWIGVKYALKARLWCVTKTARTCIAIVTSASLLKNVYTLWVAGFAINKNNGSKICTLLYPGTHIGKSFPWIDLSVSSLLPFLVLLLFNTMLVLGVKKSSKTVSDSCGNTSVSNREIRDSMTTNVQISSSNVSDYSRGADHTTTDVFTVNGEPNNVDGTRQSQDSGTHINQRKVEKTLTVKKPGTLSHNRNTTANSQRPSNKLRRKREVQLTIMMILVSGTFLFFTMPRQLFLLVWPYLNLPNTLDNLATYSLIHSITHKMWYSNSCINFLLYCLSGSQFRKELMKMFHCLRFQRRVAPLHNR